MKRRPIAFLLLPAVLSLLVAGCGEKSEPPTTGPVVAETTTGQATGSTTGGGGGGGQPATDEELIRATITDYLTKRNDPAVCDELITAGFLKRSYGNRAGCVSARKPSALATDVTILARKPGKGGTTIVTVKPQGGVFGGEALKVTVVEAGNGWRIDEITSNVKVGP